MRASAIKRILKRAPKGGKFHRTLDILRVIAQCIITGFIRILWIVCVMCVPEMEY